MNQYILQQEVQDFIIKNLKSDITKLILKGSPFKDITVQELANQIIAKKKSEQKLPTWFNTHTIYYPPVISIEQTSSEITAEYKSNLISGNSIVDITGGFGIDTFYFAKKFDTVFHCEINTELSNIVNFNYKQLSVNNIETVASDGLSFLKKTDLFFDCIYIDPSRRDNLKKKVFLLEDCSPNIITNIDFLFEKTNKILIKNSPLLDISASINSLPHIKTIHIVSIKNEVKELLFSLEKNYNGNITIETCNILKNKKQVFQFEYQEKVLPIYSEPENFLYEPNAAILKSGGFNQVSSQFKLKKLHQHSHLYTSKELISNFPGRSFKIISTLKYNKKNLLKLLTCNKANITTRNFYKSVEQIRKETKIKDGGDIYLFFTCSEKEKKLVIVCEKMRD